MYIYLEFLANHSGLGIQKRVRFLATLTLKDSDFNRGLETERS